MLDWILEKLPVVIFVVVFIAQLVRGFMRMRGTQAEPPPRHDELEQDRRNREIQEEIRRKIAERRGGRMPAPEPREAEQGETPPPTLPPRDPTALPVPEPLRRMLEQLERRAAPAAPVPPPVAVERRAAELERQERLAAEMKALEEARLLTQRRAAAIAAARADHLRSESGMRAAARGELLEDLRHPASLRRAFVLREVLGPPVGLR